MWEYFWLAFSYATIMSWYGPVRLAHLNQMTIFFMIMLQWMLKIFNEENHFSFHMKQAEKLKSCEMQEGWMKSVEGWRLNDEGWWFQAVEGFCFADRPD